MPYIPTISPEEAAGPVKELYDRELAGQGYVSNYTRAFSRRPEVLAGWLALKDAITSGMEPRLYELATVAAAKASVMARPIPRLAPVTTATGVLTESFPLPAAPTGSARGSSAAR